MCRLGMRKKRAETGRRQQLIPNCAARTGLRP